jgi:hypothetical protein
MATWWIGLGGPLTNGDVGQGDEPLEAIITFGEIGREIS